MWTIPRYVHVPRSVLVHARTRPSFTALNTRTYLLALRIVGSCFINPPWIEVAYLCQIQNESTSCIMLRCRKYSIQHKLVLLSQLFVFGNFYFFLLLVSHLRLDHIKDEPVLGWLNHFNVVTLYQQQPKAT